MNKLQLACELVCSEWVDSIEEITEIEYSENHIKNIEKIINSKNLKLGKNTIKVLLVAAVIASLTIIGFSASETVKSKTISKGKDMLNNDVLVVEELDFDKAVQTPVTDFYYSYIPEGYIQEQISEFDARCEREGLSAVRRFNKDDNHLEICKLREDTVLANNDGKSLEITENGINYLVYFSKGGMKDCINVYWNVDNYVFAVYLSGQEISLEEAMQIARGMK